METSHRNKSRFNPNTNLNTELDLLLLYRLSKKNLIWFFLLITIGLIGSYIYLRYTIPVYQSNLTLQVGSQNTAKQVLEVENFYDNQDIAEDVELLKSKFLFKRTLQSLPFDVSYYNEGNFLNHELYKKSPINVEYLISDSTVLGSEFYLKFNNNNTFILSSKTEELGEFAFNKKIELAQVTLEINKLNADYNPDERVIFVINNLDELTNKYIDQLSVITENPLAKTINISFNDNNALKTKDIVTALANEYLKFDIEERSKSSKKVLEFIDNQLDKYYNKVKVSENKIQNFQKNSNLSNTKQFSSIYITNINQYENKIIDLNLQKNVLEEIIKIAENEESVDVDNLLPILSGTEYEGSIAFMINSLQKLLVEKQNLLFRVTKNSDAIKSLEHKIKVQRNLLTESLNSQILKLEKTRKEIEGNISNIQKKFLNIPEKELEYARLQRVLSIDEKFFTMLMEKRTEYSISEAGFVPQHTILNKAITPNRPVTPNKKIILITGVLVGIVLSILLLFVRYLFKNTISEINDIVSVAVAEIGILGVVPDYKQNMPNSQLVVHLKPKSIISESFRTLRSNLKFINSNNEKKVMAITSTISGEGKTFCALNLGGIIALSGKKVVVLDLDMRKPKIHLGFGANNNIGMSTLLIGANTIEECIQSSELKGLDYITSGPIPPNPAELIIDDHLDKVIEKLKTKYDLIIIDNPPIGLVSDAMEVLQKADYPIYVFKQEYSHRNFVHNADRLILDNKIKNLSIILNGVNTKQKSYSYGYGYGYGYGTGYYDDENTSKNIFNRKK